MLYQRGWCAEWKDLVVRCWLQVRRHNAVGRLLRVSPSLAFLSVDQRIRAAVFQPLCIWRLAAAVAPKSHSMRQPWGSGCTPVHTRRAGSVVSRGIGTRGLTSAAVAVVLCRWPAAHNGIGDGKVLFGEGERPDKAQFIQDALAGTSAYAHTLTIAQRQLGSPSKSAAALRVGILICLACRAALRCTALYAAVAMILVPEAVAFAFMAGLKPLVRSLTAVDSGDNTCAHLCPSRHAAI